MQEQETREDIPIHKSSKEDPSIPSEKNAEGSKEKKSFGQKAKSGLKKMAILLMAALLLTIGGPVGIVLGLLLLGFMAKKELSKAEKKESNSLKKQVTRKKGVEKSGKLERIAETSTLEMDKQRLKSMGTKPDGVSIKKLPEDQSKATTNGNKLERVTETSTLEMDKQSLKSMGTKPDGVSIKKLPEDQSKATTNGNKLADSKFKKLGMPQAKLNKQALKRRNSLPNREKSNPQAKKKTGPNFEKTSPALKLK